MSLPVIPTQIPRPDAAGYAIEPQTALRRSQMQAGPPRVELIDNSPTVRVRQQWTFTAAEFAAFQAFHALTLLYGSKPFRAEVYRKGAWEWHDVRFAAPWTMSYERVDRFIVRAELLMLDDLVPSADSSLVDSTVSAYLNYSDAGASGAVTLGTLPNPHTPTRVDVYISEAFDGTGTNLIDVGYVGVDPDELVDAMSLDLSGQPSGILSVTTADAAPPKGAELGTAEAAERTYIAQYTDGAADSTRGRALVVLTYT